MRRLVVLVFLLAGLILLAWLARAQIAARLAGEYFRQHGVTASVGIGDLGFAGVSGRFALGPQDAPDISAARMELHFDPLSWTPRVVEVRLVDPVIRARVDAAGHVTLGSLQTWMDSLSNTQGHSRFVSDDLAVSLQGLRALVATPAGAVELDGDIKLVRSLPVTATLRLVPARLVYRGLDIALGAARITYDAAKAHLAAQLSGTVQTSAIRARRIQANFDATNFHWANAGGGISLITALAHLQIQAESLIAAVPIAAPSLDITGRNVAFVIGKDIEGQADVSAVAQGGFAVAGLRTPDPVLTRLLAQNLSRLTANISAHVERHGGMTNLTLAKPLSVTGAKGGALYVPLLRLELSPAGLTGAVQTQLRGPGLPAVSLASQHFAFADSQLRADADISARGDMAMLHGAALTAKGDVSLQDRRFTFAPSACLAVTLKAFHPGDSDLARDISGAICAVPGQPLLSVAAAGWNFNGVGQKASAFLPLANAQVSGASAGLAFQGAGNDVSGAANVTAMQVADQAAPKRFEPLAASGVANLKSWVWQGRFAAASKNYPLGEASFTHTMATGLGGAHISAPGLAFAENGLQPVALSPLLAALRNADGKVHFDGDVAWTKTEIKSGGTLGIDSLDFLTPLGRAHAVKTSIAFSSLLPPATADNQHLTISRIDWTLPLSGVDVHFGFDPKAARIGGLARRRSAPKKLAESSLAPERLASSSTAPVKSASARLRPDRSSPERSQKAKVARAPPIRPE